MSVSTSDWRFCRERLVAVSRSFSKPIELLPDTLERAVTCGYLLCRIVDTIEDHATIALPVRDRLYAAFLDVVEGGADGTVFEALIGEIEVDTENEHLLAANTSVVMRVFRDLPPAVQSAVTPWVAEMSRGMQLYSHRVPGDDGLIALMTLEDLERYCYFVAGTVGHMLTDLFAVELALEPALTGRLRARAESFGLGLQLVNILKDVTDDFERGWSFVPRSLCAAQGIGPRDLPVEAHRAAAHAALAPIFDRAERALDGALEYTLDLPVEAREVRMFCLLPLWMAVRTLQHARGNDDQFIPGRPVKISRPRVAALIADCAARADSNSALRAGFDTLRTATVLE